MGELFHVEQFGANGNGFGEGGCKSLILLRILLRKIMAICAFLQRMGSFDVERRKLLSNSVGKEGFLRGRAQNPSATNLKGIMLHGQVVHASEFGRALFVANAVGDGL